MSEPNRDQSPATGLAQRLAAAARSTKGLRRAPGRCAAPVAGDPEDGLVFERCPLRPGHEGEHEVESEFARRERLEQAAALPPGEVLDAAGVVVAWLASTREPDAGTTTPPLRQLWMVVDVAAASATVDPRPTGATSAFGEVDSDG